MKKHYFLGFLLSFLMFFTLLSSAIVISATSGIVKKNAISSLMKADEVKASIKDMAKDYIDSALKKSDDSTNNNSNEEPTTNIPLSKNNYYSFREIQLVSSESITTLPANTETTASSESSSVDISAIITDDILDQIIDAVANSMEGDSTGEMDLSGVKEDIMANTRQQATQLVNDYIDEAINNGGVIDVAKINDSPVIKDFTAKNNITINQATIDSLKEQYPEEINLNDTDVEKLKSDINKEIDENVLVELEKTVDEVVTEVEAELSKTITEMTSSKSSPISKINTIINSLVGILDLAKLALIGISIVFFLLQFIVYRKRLYSPLMNTGIVMLLCGIITYVISILPTILSGLLASILQSMDASLKPIVNSVINVAFKPFGTVGIIYIVIAVVLISGAIVMKSLLYKKEVSAA